MQPSLLYWPALNRSGKGDILLQYWRSLRPNLEGEWSVGREVVCQGAELLAVLPGQGGGGVSAGGQGGGPSHGGQGGQGDGPSPGGLVVHV